MAPPHLQGDLQTVHIPLLRILLQSDLPIELEVLYMGFDDNTLESEGMGQTALAFLKVIEGWMWSVCLELSSIHSMMRFFLEMQY